MKEKFVLLIGGAVIIMLITSLLVGGLYWLTCQLSTIALRWAFVILAISIPVIIAATYKLASNAASEHLAGFERGLDGAERTIKSVGRGLSATASMARASRNLPQSKSNDDLLPRPGAMRILDAGPSDRGNLVDL